MKVAIALLTIALLASNAHSKAAPGIIIVTGKPLTSRVILSDWNENHRLMMGLGRLVSMPEDSLRIRPSLNLAMYWGTRTYSPGLRDTVPVAFSPFGSQRGTFYPATPGREPLWWFGPPLGARESMRIVGPEALAILRRRGIPTEILQGR